MHDKSAPRSAPATPGRDTFPAACQEKYDPVEPIASGGFGTVWLATHRYLGRAAAIKVLHAQLADNPEELERFFDEARITASLSHPNIVVVHDLGIDGATPWIAYEYIPGAHLGCRLLDGPLALGDALDATIQVACALEEAHSHGVLHRDIKPQNVLEVSPGRYKVADFGLAKWRGDKPEWSRTDCLSGTPTAMAPEQIEGEPPSPSTDIYALGVFLYQLLTGRPPFDGTSLVDVLQQHLERPVAPPSALVTSTPASVDALVLWMLAKDPHMRPGSAAEVRQALEDELHRSSLAATELPGRRAASLADHTERIQAPARPRSIHKRPLRAPAARPAPLGGPARPSRRMEVLFRPTARSRALQQAGANGELRLGTLTLVGLLPALALGLLLGGWSAIRPAQKTPPIRVAAARLPEVEATAPRSDSPGSSCQTPIETLLVRWADVRTRCRQREADRANLLNSLGGSPMEFDLKRALLLCAEQLGGCEADNRVLTRIVEALHERGVHRASGAGPAHQLLARTTALQFRTWCVLEQYRTLDAALRKNQREGADTLWHLDRLLVRANAAMEGRQATAFLGAALAANLSLLSGATAEPHSIEEAIVDHLEDLRQCASMLHKANWTEALARELEQRVTTWKSRLDQLPGALGSTLATLAVTHWEWGEAGSVGAKARHLERVGQRSLSQLRTQLTLGN